MISVKRVVLDVLKPHHPNALDFARAVAERGGDYHVRVTVLAVDEKTESVQLEVNGGDIDFEALHAVINHMGGSLHSIDEVEVLSGE